MQSSRDTKSTITRASTKDKRRGGKYTSISSIRVKSILSQIATLIVYLRFRKYAK